MSEMTDRLTLPLLVAGQAQKEMFHNEALAMLDIAVQASVVAVGTNGPPETPVPGECWVVGSTPSGAWADHPQELAGWTQGGWRFVAPQPGMSVWDQSSGEAARFDGTGWRIGQITASRLAIGGVQVVGARQPAVVAPAGGATVDAEARGAIAAILAGLRAHGLIAP